METFESRPASKFLPFHDAGADKLVDDRRLEPVRRPRPGKGDGMNQTDLAWRMYDNLNWAAGSAPTASRPNRWTWGPSWKRYGRRRMRFSFANYIFC